MKTIKIKSIVHLKKLTYDKEREFKMLLNGGAFSRKGICYNSDLKRFEVHNYIDDSNVTITEKSLNNNKITLIGEAILKQALYMI